MLKTTLTLLPNCSGKISYEGEPVKAVGYYSQDTNKRLNTISIHTINFTGRIYLYGSIKTNPVDDTDWALIPIGENTDYIEFDNIKNTARVIKENKFVNIKGNYVWFKAKMDRSYLDLFNHPLAVTYRPSYVLNQINVLSDETIPMDLHERKIPEESRIPPKVLSYYGNVEKILLCY